MSKNVPLLITYVLVTEAAAQPARFFVLKLHTVVYNTNLIENSNY